MHTVYNVLTCACFLAIEDVETSLSDYLKALSMLERLAEPDSRHIAELYPSIRLIKLILSPIGSLKQSESQQLYTNISDAIP